MDFGKWLMVACLSLIMGCSNDHIFDRNDNEAKTASLYDSFLDGEVALSKLNLFMSELPKGGDLHHHYSGTIYVETYLEWLEEKQWGIFKETLKISPAVITKSTKTILTVTDLKNNGELYRKLLTLWSDKDFGNHCHVQPPPDTNFFNTFSFLKQISPLNHHRGFKVLKTRAIKENVSYIETMVSQVGVKSSAFFTPGASQKYIIRMRAAQSQQEVDTILNELASQLKTDAKFQGVIDGFQKSLNKNHQGIDDNDFMMRYQVYGVRVLDPLQVFCDLYSGFIAANTNKLVVGVNIVAPENNHVSLLDYTLHMRMFNYLNRQYPKVNRALHAGELTLGVVRPKNLKFHINEALNIAKSQRIGHGVDLPFESVPLELLEQLKSKAVIEINLTSNEFILGVKGQEHPYLIYDSYGVPMIISTDDSGVSRNNLTNEYVLLASRYKPSYKKIKEYIYNSAKYSFLSREDKAKLKKRIDQKFLVFEKKMSQQADLLK